nr:MAG TPA: hypothetical protein [Caudoviricetes sp.]
MKGVELYEQSSSCIREPVYEISFKNPISFIMNKSNANNFIRKMTPVPSGVKMIEYNIDFKRIR